MKKNLLIVCLFIISGKTFSQFTIYNTSNSGLNDNNAWFINQKSTGDVWVGTNYGGASKYNGSTWTNYTTSNSGISAMFITPIQFKGTDIWMGSYNSLGGISVYNGSTWSSFKTSNSMICGDDIMSIAFDASGTAWVATRFTGLCKFDGVTWTTYNTSNSGIPNNGVYHVETDPSGNVWVGTALSGLAKFNGTTWTTYNTSNSLLPNNDIYSLKYNTATNSIWIGTNGGLAVLTGTTWAVHTTTNSNFPGNYVRGISHSYSTGNTWIATGNGGIGRWDGFTWKTYNTSNSNLPSNLVWSIKAGASSNVWAALMGAGVVSMPDQPSGFNEPDETTLQFSLYPNPAINSAEIKVKSENGGNATLLIYDNLGKMIKEINLNILPNTSEITQTIDLSELSSGFYSCTFQFNNSSVNRKLVIQK